MKKEIERKYLVKMDLESILSIENAFDKRLIAQYYAFGCRFRQSNDEYFVTYKSDTPGISRVEIEKTIPKWLYDFVRWVKKPKVLAKNRYCIELKHHTLELDEFLGDNEGLVLAEIELTGVDEIVYDLPRWVGKDVTTDYRYRNQYLFSKPYKVWSYE